MLSGEGCAVDYLLVLRLPLLVLGVLASFSLAFYVGKPIGEVLLIVGAIGFANTGWNLYNELVDVETDKKQKPYKPIPSGTVDVLKLWVLFTFLMLLSVLSLIGLYSYHQNYLIIGILTIIVPYFYNDNTIVGRGIGGNIALGITYGLAGYLAMYPYHIIFPLGFMLFTISFNILVQAQDIEGDEEAGVVTVPQQIGIGWTGILSIVMAVLSLMIFYELPGYFIVFGFASMMVVLTGLVYLFVSLGRGDMYSMIRANTLTQWFLRRFARIFLLLGFIILIFVRLL